MEKISVIIPVYNVRNYLSDCIESVLRQTYNNIEAILVDDGSTDGSDEICEQYSKTHDNVRVFHKKNGGLGEARNYGLRKASGRFVMFVDSDDYIAEDMLESMYGLVRKEKADYCKSGFVRVNNEQKIESTKRYKRRVYRGAEIISRFLPRFFGSLPEKSDSVEMSVCACLFDREIIEKNQIKFLSEKKVLSEDIFFNIDYLKKSKCACLSDFTGYFYRANQSSLTRSYRADRFEKSKHLNRLLLEVLEGLGYGEEERNRLRKHFFINIRSSLAQEKSTVSGLSFLESRHNIKRICCDNDIKKIISEYPINKLGIKQRIFIWLIKRRLVTLLMLFINFGMI